VIPVFRFLVKSRYKFELVADSDTHWARLTGSKNYFSSTSGIRAIRILQNVIPLFCFAKSRYKLELVTDSDTHWARLTGSTSYFSSTSGLRAFWIDSPIGVSGISFFCENAL